MPDYTWNQGRISSSTGVVDFTNTSGIVTSLIRLPLGSYEFVLPYVVVQFRKVTNGSESDISYSNIKRYIYLYDEQDSFITRYQITNERYLFENANWYNTKSFRFECYYSGNTLMYPEVQQEMLGTYYYKVLCSFYFNVVEFHKENDIWISDDSIPFSNIEVTTPIPASYWRIDSNSYYPYHENLKTIQNIPEPSIPASYWRIDRYHNDGYPWHERLLDISYNPPSDNPVYKTPTLYELYADGKLVWSSNNIDSNYGIITPTLEIEDSLVKQLKFKIPPNNYFYNKFERLKTKLKVFRNHKEIFEGRILSESIDIWGNRDVLGEGNLGYFNDTRQPQKEYSFYTATQILEAILQVHNSKVDVSRKFENKYGKPNFYISCSKSFPREDKYWYTQYESTLNAIENLAKELKCHIDTYVDEDGNRAIRLFENITEVSKQKIIFGSNLQDYTRSYDMAELATVLLPLGKYKNTTNDAGDEMIPGDPNGAIEEVDGGNTVAWREYGYHHDSWDASKTLMLRSNEDEDVYDSEKDIKGTRVVTWCFEEGGDPDFTYDYHVNWVENVKEGDVFYLEATLPDKSLLSGRQLYFYTIRDANHRQLACQAASASGQSSVDVHLAPVKRQDGTKTEDTRIKITVPATGAYLAVAGCTKIHVDDTQTYPFKLYKQRKLPNEMNDYVTVEKAQVPVDPSQPSGAKKDYDSLYIQATPRTIEIIDQTGHATQVTVDPLAEWGYIEKTAEFNDIEDPTDLYNKAVKYLQDYQFDKLEIKLTALDGVVLGVDLDYVMTYQKVRCISPKHGLDKEFPVTKTTLYLDDPSQNKYELNSTNELSITQTNSSVNSELLNKIAQAGTRSETLDLAKKNAYNQIRYGDTGVVSLNKDEYGNIESISIASTAVDWRNARQYWLWNYQGMMFVDLDLNPQPTPSYAVTNDGRIIANELMANSIISTTHLTGEMNIGGLDGTTGKMRIYRGSTVDNKLPLSGEMKTNGEFVTYSIPEGGQGETKSYRWSAIVDGHLSLGNGYGVPQPEETGFDARNETTYMQIGYYHVNGSDPSIEQVVPTINTNMGQVLNPQGNPIGSDRPLYLKCSDLYISGSYDQDTGCGYTGEYVAGYKTLTFYKGILVGIVDERE